VRVRDWHNSIDSVTDVQRSPWRYLVTPGNRPPASNRYPVRHDAAMNSLLDYQAAAVGFAVAFLLVVLLTPVVSLAASRAGVLDRTDGDRRMHLKPLPRLGGLAIFAGIAIPCAAFGSQHGFWGVMLGAALMCALGAIDDVVSLPAGAKFAGQIGIAAVPVALSSGNISIDHVTLPLIGVFDFGPGAYPVTIIWIVAIANIVNFIDGMDGLAAGFCAIAAMTFAILAASLGHADTAAVAAVVAGAAIGFLRYNFHPATIIMGDSGSLMLGYLLATLAIEGVLKTAAAVSLVFPLVILALPILDTSFVILKRLKYRQPIYQADRWHFHHRFANIGFSQRRTALTLYAWCIVLSSFALAIRFVPPHRHGWSISAVAILGTLGGVAVLSSVYVIYTLEILKLRRLRALRGSRAAAAHASADRPAA
jgi:UDP-GlcNAc:undecaprenyl-phosphate/decaprenyl-phosphate GlcNAc-1-phosphate transferase